jgi:hypothetical protein
MTIRAGLLAELLNIFPADAIVRGFADGLSVMNADGTGEVVILNNLGVPSNKITPIAAARA